MEIGGLLCLPSIYPCFEATNSMSWRTVHQKNAELKYLPFRRLVFISFTSLNTIHSFQDLPSFVDAWPERH